jgi:recombinational DNA repair protein (RecF pathway)
MTPLVEQIANALRASPSHAHCLRCLAMTLATPEPALREAAQRLILQEGFEVGDRQCVNCQRFEKAVWFNARLDSPRCGLCRTPILPAAARRTVNGIPYHLGCWQRKVRQAQKKKA